MIRVLQLTDLHLLADPDAKLKEVPTRWTLADVIAHIRRHEAPPDRIVLTGDLAHDEKRETYEALRQVLDDWLPRTHVIPGNHDDRRAMRDALPECSAPGEGPLTFSLDAGGWRLLGLDTQVPGDVAGRIGIEQLDWLENQLGAARNRPVAMFMHHPPVSVQSTWLDRLGLTDAPDLRDVVRRHRNVRIIACGHVHHEFRGSIGQVQVVTTPSTAIQFDPAGDESHYTALPPGYRVFELDGPELRTRVGRLETCRFPPASDSE